MSLTLSAVYEEVPESAGGGYVAYTEELPGAISEGETLEEARENLRDAIELLLQANRELASKSHRGKKVDREKITVPVWWVMKRVELIRHLESHGCMLLHEGTNHSVDYNPAAQRTSTVPEHREVKNPTAIRICKQLSVPD